MDTSTHRPYPFSSRRLALALVFFSLAPCGAGESTPSFAQDSFAVGYGFSGRASPNVAATTSGSKEPYVLLYGADSAFMSGSMEDAERAQQLRADLRQDLLWFRHAGRDYIIRDPATIETARQILSSPLAVGRREEDLATELGRLVAEQRRLDAQEDSLAAEQVEGRGIQNDSRSDQRKELERKRQGLDHRIGELGRLHDQVTRKADKELRTLFEQAIEKGTAQESE